MNWKEIKCKGINSIEKLTAEFDISAFDLIGDLFNDGEVIPYAGFKVRVYETQDNNSGYTAYMNLKLRDSLGGYEGSIGYGQSEDEALQTLIHHFIEQLKSYKEEKKTPIDQYDFHLVAYDEF